MTPRTTQKASPPGATVCHRCLISSPIVHGRLRALNVSGLSVAEVLKRAVFVAWRELARADLARATEPLFSFLSSVRSARWCFSVHALSFLSLFFLRASPVNVERRAVPAILLALNGPSRAMKHRAVNAYRVSSKDRSGH